MTCAVIYTNTGRQDHAGAGPAIYRACQETGRVAGMTGTAWVRDERSDVDAVIVWSLDRLARAAATGRRIVAADRRPTDFALAVPAAVRVVAGPVSAGRILSSVTASVPDVRVPGA